MKRLIVAFALATAALAGGSVAHAANNTKAGPATPTSQATDISAQHRHGHAYGHRHHHWRHHGRPYYRSYGYYPRPHGHYHGRPYGHYRSGPGVSLHFGSGHRW